MPREPKNLHDAHVSPFDPNWRQYFKDREQNILVHFEGGPLHNPEKGWIVEGLLPRGYLALLAGKPKDGKTCLVVALAYAVAKGIPFAGMNTVQAPVMYFATEESREEWDRAIHPHLPKDQRGLGIGHTSNFRIDHEPDLWALRLAIDRYKPGLIVVDPLLAACEAGDFSNARRARNALTGLKLLCMEKGVAAIVVHHAKERQGEARRVAENPQLAATASLNIVLNHHPHPKGRLVDLSLKGRGDFANRTLRLLSTGPCHYEPAQAPKNRRQPRPQKPGNSGTEKTPQYLKSGGVTRMPAP